MSVIKIALVGVGKIAQTEHIPSIKNSPNFELVACASPNTEIPGVPCFKTDKEMLEAIPEIEAVAMCQPSQYRTNSAIMAIAAGKHVLLEKPPASTLSESQKIITHASKRDSATFMTWHSRYAASVALLKSLLIGRHIERVNITWLEDVRKWHPNQDWIWQPGGFGVFDPGINALSIMTEVLPLPVSVTRSEIFFPKNKRAPIAANITFSGSTSPIVEAVFDWRQEGDEKWEIEIYAADDHFVLSSGGADLFHNGGQISSASSQSEYDAIYERFFELIKTGQSEMDILPMQHVADAFMRAEFFQVEPFDD